MEAMSRAAIPALPAMDAVTAGCVGLGLGTKCRADAFRGRDSRNHHENKGLPTSVSIGPHFVAEPGLEPGGRHLDALGG